MSVADPVSSRIIQVSATFHDEADRPTHEVNYGTNREEPEYAFNATAPTITQGYPPTPSETVLVTVTRYDDRGLVDTVTSPAGQETNYRYDDLGRRIATIENFVDDVDLEWNETEERWEVTDGLDHDEMDTNRVTSFVYDINNNVRKQVAHFPDESDEEAVQITEYVYGVTTSGNDPSALASKDLLFQIHYPQESGANAGQPGTTDEYTVTHRYNRQGELTYIEDQNGTTHEYTHDKLGRITLDEAAAGAGSDIDDTINAIATSYYENGLLDEVISYSDYGGGGQDDANGVKFRYNGLW